MSALRFEIVYPGVASIPCRDCQKFVYNLETGEKVVDADIGEFVERDGPPPCASCPKEEIDLDGKRLSLDERNVSLYQMWREVKVAGGEVIPVHLRQCSVFLENLVLVDDVVKSAREARKAMAIRDSRSKAEE